MRVNWNAREITLLVRSALREDHARHDLTTQILIRPSCRIQASIVSKQAGVVAGPSLAEKFLKAVDRSIGFKALVSDGAHVKPGRRLAVLEGKATSILAGERPAL